MNQKISEKKKFFFQRKAINVIRRKGGIEKLDPNGLSASVRNRARGKICYSFLSATP